MKSAQLVVLQTAEDDAVEIKSEAESLKFYHPTLESKRNSSVRISVIKNLGNS